MDKDKILREFAEQHPESIGIYGYGSGVLKQVSYSEEDKPQVDLIFIVDDIKKWHQENIQANKEDYSWIGKCFFSLSGKEKLKGHNKITYQSRIPFKGYKFKYGVTEVEDFKKNLSSWDIFFLAGRFQKPMKEIKSNEEIKKIIEYNRECALRISLLYCKGVDTLFNVFKNIAAFSYIGDTRMLIAENPKKVFNIVNGHYEAFEDIYAKDTPYLRLLNDGLVFIDHKYILSHLDFLPTDLLDFLAEYGTDLNDIESVKANIFLYFKTKNSLESAAQTLEGVRTNGVVRTVPYVIAKVKKRFKT